MVKETKLGLCRGCAHDQSQCLADIEDGKLVKLRNFKGSEWHQQLNKPTVFECNWTPAKCPKNQAMIELLYDDRRTKYPLKRKGERGEGKWERISWDQALDEIAKKIGAIRDKYGGEAIGGIFGSSDEQWDQGRFFNCLGSPNNCNINSPVCSGIETFMNIVCIGGNTCYGPPTDKVKCFVMWSGEHWITAGQKRNIELLAEKTIVVNSTGSGQARKATIWLQPRPGTDTALGFGWLYVIINEGLYDKEFVERWTHGFEQLKERVNEFPLERVEEITWVPKQKIIDAARLYATTKPASINWGTACGHIGRNAAETERVRIALRAVTGNLDIDGGNHISKPHSKLVSFKSMLLDEVMPVSQYRKSLDGDRFRVYGWRGWELLPDKKSQRSYVSRSSKYPSLIHAIRTGVPYRVRAVFTAMCNPLVGAANIRNVYEALKRDVDLHVSMEVFMTPTAMLADYVLPVTFWPEKPRIPFLEHPNTVFVGQQLVPKGYERLDDYDIYRGLAQRLGFGEYWPWKDLKEVQDYRLQNFGMTLDEFAEKVGWDTEPPQFNTHEKGGFQTTTGKVELWSTIFEACGYDPLPHYEEPAESPVSTPELAKEYPYILISRRPRFYLHSQYRQAASLRRRHNEPFVRIHPETAEKHGIKDGDMVWIENRRGKIYQKARITKDVSPQVVQSDFGWWFPEKPGEEPSLFGLWEQNYNVLSSDALDHACECSGSWYLQSMLCKIYKKED
jgi:anaerobic selenocysteine-containing dehydrogenase